MVRIQIQGIETRRRVVPKKKTHRPPQKLTSLSLSLSSLSLSALSLSTGELSLPSLSLSTDELSLTSFSLSALSLRSRFRTATSRPCERRSRFLSPSIFLHFCSYSSFFFSTVWRTTSSFFFSFSPTCCCSAPITTIGKQMAEEAVLGFLEKNEVITDSGEFAVEKGISHEEIVNVIKSLNGFRFVDAQDIKKERWQLTAEGKTYAANGSPEFQLFMAIPSEGISRVELQKKLGDSVFKIGCQQAIKNKWVEMGKSQVSKKVAHVDDNVKAMLVRINDGEALNQEDIDALKRRKLISPQIWKGYSVRKGPNYAPKRRKPATDLTRENLQRGDWKDLQFKEYNFSAKGLPAEGGYLHPLLKVRRQMQMIFLQMGFEEMPTNNYVESSFWNFDALFQPQQHPARDSHDTFFLREPSTTKTLPEDYVERVKQIHESGGHGSRGYGYDWKREEANKNLLRTHTTAVSSRMLYALAQKPFEAKKYYSVDRVFRNEAVDRTHLAEFHQIEGLICDRGLTLGDLQGVLYDFFSRLGMSKLRFKPAYNPYTEPSMEIFGYHEGFKKWVEVGNSGMFRPEMLLPMGLPEDVRVIAWGLSLERPTMILYGIDNIRDLFGHKVDLGLIKSNPICRIGLQ